MERKEIEGMLMSKKPTFKSRLMTVLVVFAVFWLVDAAVSSIFSDSILFTLILTFPISLFLLFVISIVWISSKFNKLTEGVASASKKANRRESGERTVVKSTTKNTRGKKKRGLER